MIYLQNLSKGYGGKILFEEINFHLRPNEKVGLVGENGVGKTTLFRVIAGTESADSGKVILRKGARAALLAQELSSVEESVLDRVIRGDAHFDKVRREMERLEQDSRHPGEGSGDWTHRYGELQHEFERLGGYGREAEAKSILSGLGFLSGQWDRPVSEFSGGWRMRVELARLLLQNPDVLLLDEPTNHLDLTSAVWLESFLKTYEGGVLLISHDRRFLNGIAERIAELGRATLTCYTGNYDDYETGKREQEIRLEAAAANQARRVAQVERFIDRFRAKNTKATQVQSRVKMLDRMERVETVTHTKKVAFRFPQPKRAGRIVLELSGIDKSYGSIPVYKNFSIRLERGWKVALVGKNGAGKSTLLKLMAGVLDFEKGKIKVGANVTRARFAQHHHETLDPSHTVMESLEAVAGHLPRTQKHNILGAFLFSGKEVDKKVSVLSGGERSRLALARMLATPASLLLLDEPTNHLDMRSIEILSAALADYEGTLCTISHDRYFLDGIINRVWEIEDQTVREYAGNYSDYQYAKSREAETESAEPSNDSLQEKNSPAKVDRDRKRREAEIRNQRHRQLKPLQTRLAQVEQRLEQVMDEKQRTELELARQDIHREDQKTRLLKTLERHKELVCQEENLLREWDEVHESIERLSGEPAAG
ncbi:MAG: ATP-binding cassette domain-containing protein [Nitrospinaceae bacterium]